MNQNDGRLFQNLQQIILIREKAYLLSIFIENLLHRDRNRDHPINMVLAAISDIYSSAFPFNILEFQCKYLRNPHPGTIQQSQYHWQHSTMVIDVCHTLCFKTITDFEKLANFFFRVDVWYKIIVFANWIIGVKDVLISVLYQKFSKAMDCSISFFPIRCSFIVPKTYPEIKSRLRKLSTFND